MHAVTMTPSKELELAMIVYSNHIQLFLALTTDHYGGMHSASMLYNK